MMLRSDSVCYLLYSMIKSSDGRMVHLMTKIYWIMLQDALLREHVDTSFGYEDHMLGLSAPSAILGRVHEYGVDHEGNRSYFSRSSPTIGKYPTGCGRSLNNAWLIIGCETSPLVEDHDTYTSIVKQ